jgi:Ca-activated chloride channel family protein
VYGHEHLLRLQAIRRLQERYLPLDAIQERLSRLSTADLQEAVDNADTALEQPATAARVATTLLVEPEATQANPDEQHWVRWVLTPGVEVHLAEHVDAETRQLVRELCEEYVRRHTPRRKR